MEVAELTATRTRVAMVWPDDGLIVAPIVDVRASPDGASELVDQLHWGERVRILGGEAEHLYVQAEDHYLGWIREDTAHRSSAYGGRRIVATTLAPLRERPDEGAAVLAYLPAGASLPVSHGEDLGAGLRGGWDPVLVAVGDGGTRSAYVSLEDTVLLGDLPRRPPTASDLIATAEAFLDVPYLWGGTTALGLDCSGFVQQVYRLNGIRLDRDAAQQAMEGRPVDAPRPGDLIFFGEKGLVTHVGMAVDERVIVHAPQKGGRVERWTLGPGRTVLALRRYLP